MKYKIGLHFFDVDCFSFFFDIVIIFPDVVCILITHLFLNYKEQKYNLQANRKKDVENELTTRIAVSNYKN